MTHEDHVKAAQREFYRVVYSNWLNSWRGKWWRFRHHLPEWWRTKQHDVRFIDEVEK